MRKLKGRERKVNKWKCQDVEIEENEGTSAGRIRNEELAAEEGKGA
jgi:hypothetical protein